METKKERFIKILKRVLIGLSIGFNVFFLIAMIIGGASVKKTNKLNKVDNVSENVNFIKENKRLVSYNDEDYEITLNVNELNNYRWDNFYSFLNTDSNYGAVDIYYDSNLYTYDETSNDSLNWSYNTDYMICFVFDYESFNSIQESNFTTNYHFAYIDAIEGFVIFDNDLKLSLDSPANYNLVKNAIELDIQANSGTMTDGIFETLTESTVSFIGTLGSGIVAMTSVFYDSANSQLTTIGLLSVIVVAVSLSYFLFRLIIGLIRMRG